MVRRLQVAHGLAGQPRGEGRASEAAVKNATSASWTDACALSFEGEGDATEELEVLDRDRRSLAVCAIRVVARTCSSSDSDSNTTGDSGADPLAVHHGSEGCDGQLERPERQRRVGDGDVHGEEWSGHPQRVRQGVEPGNHGLHVHNGADCTNPGPHYGPDGGPYHGEFTVKVDDSGNGSLTTSDLNVTVSPGDYSVIGHPLVLHFLSDGGSAPPAACTCSNT